MRKYINVYPWDVLDKIEEGKTVYMLDKEFAAVFEVNNLSIVAALKWISVAKENHGRFEFWYAEQEDKEND